ncbi:hypothetical protein C5167_048231 [Papaver somniferum]|uniref:Uncharacterized protein n=1 Tax=Papaver somniferum TaxID=3469 RepID=A0A4Y7KHC4_PAPSO|nr:hypothetical protein C5167_048231 [Papaver somniferum]
MVTFGGVNEKSKLICPSGVEQNPAPPAPIESLDTEVQKLAWHTSNELIEGKSFEPRFFSHVKVEGSSDTDEHHHVTKKPYHDEICQLDESPVEHEHWHTTL